MLLLTIKLGTFNINRLNPDLKVDVGNADCQDVLDSNLREKEVVEDHHQEEVSANNIL
jgi:hypothetical protein